MVTNKLIAGTPDCAFNGDDCTYIIQYVLDCTKHHRQLLSPFTATAHSHSHSRKTKLHDTCTEVIDDGNADRRRHGPTGASPSRRDASAFLPRRHHLGYSGPGLGRIVRRHSRRIERSYRRRGRWRDNTAVASTTRRRDLDVADDDGGRQRTSVSLRVAVPSVLLRADRDGGGGRVSRRGRDGRWQRQRR